jgi:hypothetical protein
MPASCCSHPLSVPCHDSHNTHHDLFPFILSYLLYETSHNRSACQRPAARILSVCHAMTHTTHTMIFFLLSFHIFVLLLRWFSHVFSLPTFSRKTHVTVSLSLAYHSIVGPPSQYQCQTQQRQPPPPLTNTTTLQLTTDPHTCPSQPNRLPLANRAIVTIQRRRCSCPTLCSSTLCCTTALTSKARPSDRVHPAQASHCHTQKQPAPRPTH